MYRKLGSHFYRVAGEAALRFRPKILTALKGYTPRAFGSDLTAGITVGIVALPLAMAFGIASGVTPAAGLYTAIVAGFLISLLGGSRVQIGGPTGAFVVIISGIIAQYGMENLALCTIMAGVILVLIGLTGLGSTIRYIPRPVTVGFTNGIAVLILLTQVKDFFGFKGDSPAEFFERIGWLASRAPEWNPASTALAVGTVALLLLWPVLIPKRLVRFLPGTLVVVLLGTLAALFLHLDVETIGSRFGGIPHSLPALHFPAIDLKHLENLIPPATTIALLAAIESLLSAVVADGMIDDRHDSNTELVAQGIANIASPLFGGIPATGAIVRTATNARSGARTPIAGIVHALTLLAILAAAAPLAKFIPLSILAGILVVVSIHMGDWKEFLLLNRIPRSDALVLLTAFGLTVMFNLTIAVETGMVLAAILFIRRVALMTDVSPVDPNSETEGMHHSLHGKELPEGVHVFRIFGVLMLGAADKLENVFLHDKEEQRVTILQMHKLLAMDATALDILERLHTKLAKRGSHLVLAGPHTQPLFLMERAGFLDRIGMDNLCPDLDTALERARVLIKDPAKIALA